MRKLIYIVLHTGFALATSFVAWFVLTWIFVVINEKMWPGNDNPMIFVIVALFFPLVSAIVCFCLLVKRSLRKMKQIENRKGKPLFSLVLNSWSRILDRFTEQNVTSESDWAALSSGQVKEAGEARAPLGGTSASSALPSQPPVVPPRNTINQELARVDAMDGHTFEHWCAALLEKVGFYNVSVTRASGDQGVDVVATKDGVKYAIQCKCYSSDLGNKPIQEVNAGKVIYHCHIGVVMTNRHFTAGAKEAAEATNILLWDRDTLVRLMKMRR